MTFSVTWSLEFRDHFVTIRQITKAPDDMSVALIMPESDGAPARTRTGAPGLGNRCSIRLSYRGTAGCRCIGIETACSALLNLPHHRFVCHLCSLLHTIVAHYN